MRGLRHALTERRAGGRPALLTEVSPPVSADLARLRSRVRPLLSVFDAVQLTDNPMARVHMGNLAPAARLVDDGFDVIVNLTCRDRNSIAQQGSLLAAAAVGAGSVFCLRGDPPELGDTPGARPVYELSALEWLALARRLRDEGVLSSGRRLEAAPELLLGAALAPASPGPEGRPERVQQKLAAGADYLITQPIFDVPAFARFAERAAEGPHQPSFIAGLSPVRDPEMAEAMGKMPGLHVPDGFIAALRRTAPADRERVAWAEARDRCAALLEIPGVQGIMLYPLDNAPERLAERGAELGLH